MKKLLLAVLLAAALAAGIVLLRQGGGADQHPATSPSEPPLKTTGIYADDWASLCGPLQGAEQARCTDRLDAAYGRKAGVPVGK